MNKNSKTYEEENTSPSWYAQLFSYLMMLGFGIKSILLLIPELFYPDNPALNKFFTFVNTNSWLTYFTYLSPLSLVLNIVSTWRSIKKFYDAENKNLTKLVDLTIKIITTAAGAIFLGLFILGSAALALKVTPYLLLGATGLGVLYGLFNIGKHIYRAFMTEEMEKRKEHLIAAGKQLISTVINALAFVVTFFLSFQVNAQLGQLNGKIFHDFDIIQSVGAIFEAAIPFVYALTACVSLGMIPSVASSAWEMNRETAQAIKKLFTEPGETIKFAGRTLAEKCKNLWRFVQKTHYLGIIIAPLLIGLEVVSIIATAGFRILALAIAPMQLIISGIRQCLTSKKATVEAKSNAASTKAVLAKLRTDEPVMKTKESRNIFGSFFTKTKAADQAIISDYLTLQTKMTNKIAILETYGVKICSKDASKLALVRSIKVHFENGSLSDEMLDFLIKEAKRISPRVFQSFWREIGKVEEIVADVRNYLAQSAEMKQNISQQQPIKSIMPAHENDSRVCLHVA